MNREDMKTRMRRFEDETGVRGIKNAQLNLKWLGISWSVKGVWMVLDASYTLVQGLRPHELSMTARLTGIPNPGKWNHLPLVLDIQPNLALD